MIKKLMLILSLLTIPFLSFTQNYLRIDSLVVYDIVETESENIIEEGFGEGPFVFGYFTLCNNSDKPLNFESSDIYMQFYYEYRGEKKSSMYLHGTVDDDIFQIKPMDSVSFEGGAILMIDVALHKSHRSHSHALNIIDHSKIFKLVLPSLYAEIKTKGNFILKTPTYTWKLTDYIEIENSNYIKAYPVVSDM